MILSPDQSGKSSNLLNDDSFVDSIRSNDSDHSDKIYMEALAGTKYRFIYLKHYLCDNRLELLGIDTTNVTVHSPDNHHYEE